MKKLNFTKHLKKIFNSFKPSTKELEVLKIGLDETYERFEEYLTNLAYYNVMPIKRIKVDVSKITEEGMKQVNERVLKIHDLCEKYNASVEIKGIDVQYKEDKEAAYSVFIVMSQAWSYDKKSHPNYKNSSLKTACKQ